jgi:peptide/nickel transport system substrate-binding protein
MTVSSRDTMGGRRVFQVVAYRWFLRFRTTRCASATFSFEAAGTSAPARPHREAHDSLGGRTMRRRRAPWTALALLLTLSLLAAACGGSDDSGGAATPAGTGDAGAVDAGGVLQTGGDITLAPTHMDPTKVEVLLSSLQEYVYGTLLRLTPEGKVEPDLAESAVVVDPSNLTVTLRKGLTFTDGTVLDAAALKASWQRNLAESAPGGLEAEFRQIDTLTVSAPLVLDVKLKQPVAGAFYRLLRLGETSPYSMTAARGGQLDTKPVGAGPFKLKNLVQNQVVEYEKNPGYWNAKNIKLAGIKVTAVTAQAATNALRSKAVDTMSALAVTQASELKGVSGLSVTIRPSTSVTLTGLLCKSKPPFDDLKVRQALNYATDRTLLNKQVYDGQAEPAWGFNGSKTPYFGPSLDNYYKYDLAKAKALLKEAGKPDLAFEMFYLGSPDAQQSAEVLQQQWAKAGVKVSLKPMAQQADFFPDAKGAPIAIFPLNRVGVSKVSRTLVPGSFGNICNWDDPVLNKLVLDLNGVAEDSPEGIALWKKVSERALETAAQVFGLFTTEAIVYNSDRLGGVEYYEGRTGIPTLDLTSLYVKK